MQSLLGGVLIVLGLIVARGVLAMAEFALTSARKSRLKDRASRGDRGARRRFGWARIPSDFSPAVQGWIALLGALAGVYGGATLEPGLGRAIGENGPMAPYRDAIGLGVIALGITAATLVLGEFVPRRLALNRPEPIAGLVSRPIRALAVVTNPIVGALERGDGPAS